MLSRLQVFKSSNVPVRVISTTSSLMKFGEYYVPKKLELEKCPPDYKEHPDRDIVNFPRVELKAYPPKTRLGFIPENWFTFFYNKTGVSGPYVFGVGLLTFMLSKEIYIWNSETNLVIGGFITLYWTAHAFKKPVAEMIDHVQEEMEKPMRSWRTGLEKHLKNQSEEIADHLKCTVASGPMYFQAYRENYYLAMEAEYRRRLDEYKKAIKRKLDFFVELEDAKRQYQRRHMVDWVVEHVKNSITDQVQKAALNQCVSNLKMLSQKASA